jgi:hypothetical protein
MRYMFNFEQKCLILGNEIYNLQHPKKKDIYIHTKKFLHVNYLKSTLIGVI